MINWAFIIAISAIVAVIIELVKKLPFLTKEWKSNGLRDLTIMLIAFATSTVLAVFVGISLDVCTSISQGVSYSIIVWCVQKVIGQEAFHKALSKKVESA